MNCSDGFELGVEFPLVEHWNACAN